MRTDPTDRDLVAAHLGGDRAALGEIYDRYETSLYDTAAAMLHDRHEAADAMQEVFLVAAQKLDQLRDPDRLKPWLFAVLRNEVYRRTKQRSRSRPTDFSLPGAGEMVAPADPTADAGAIERDELAALVRTAAAGLDDRDQLVMELTLRQDLSGDDLAAAVGVTTKQAHVLVHRMRERLLRSLGALTVARMGRDDCTDLAAILEQWDGTFSVLIRKRVARHVDRCAVCDETRSRYPAGVLFAAAPVLAAPAELRDAVLTAATSGAQPGQPPDFDGDGFPGSVSARRSRGAWLAAAALVVLALVVGVNVASSDRVPVSAPGTTAGASPNTSPSTAATDTSTTSTTTTAPSTTDTTIVTTTPPTTAAPVAGSVVVSATSIDLGATEGSAEIGLTNPGDTLVRWSLTRTSASPFVWNAVSGQLGAGETRQLAVSVDRSPLDEGEAAGSFTIAGGGASTPVQVRASVERAPEITDVRGPSSVGCSPSSADVVLARVTDESPVATVELQWSGPGGDGSVAMTDLGRGEFEGTLDPERTDGNWTFRVVATDARGNVGTVSRPFVISGCGGGGGRGGGGGFTS